MSLESDLTTLLNAFTPNVFPDFAPEGTAAPYITYQAIGGRPLRWLDGSAADKRHTLVQINVWTGTRAATLTMIRQIEEAMCASVIFTARPAAEPTSEAEEALLPPLYGSHQDFDIYSAR